jgi:hypothetical protein
VATFETLVTKAISRMDALICDRLQPIVSFKLGQAITAEQRRLVALLHEQRKFVPDPVQCEDDNFRHHLDEY